MADQNVYSHAGVKFAISTTAQNGDLTLSEFEGLTYTDVSSVGSIGEYGISTNMLTYDTMDTLVSKKAKGITNAGDPALEVARMDSDAGQLAMRTAGAPDYFDSHAFKVTKQDGSIDFLRGLVSGPSSPGGRNEDFDLHNFTLALNQAVIHKNATV